MVSPVGIEPTTNWLKASCSTTELRARGEGRQHTDRWSGCQPRSSTREGVGIIHEVVRFAWEPATPRENREIPVGLADSPLELGNPCGSREIPAGVGRLPVGVGKSPLELADSPWELANPRGSCQIPVGVGRLQVRSGKSPWESDHARRHHRRIARASGFASRPHENSVAPAILPAR